jgi:hypothetical protein
MVSRALGWIAVSALLTATFAAAVAPASAAKAVRNSPAAYAGADGRIAFVRGGDIFSVEPDGTGLRQLTRSGQASGPVWSPDGKRIAYLYRGNLWIMNAGGRDKTRITSSAPAYADGRAAWSPNGRYLAFVKSRRHHGYGYLTRYDTVTHRFAAFTDVIAPPHLIKIAVLAGTAVAWAWARDATGVTHGSFLLYEGTRAQCAGERFCLNALGFPHQDQYQNGYPSAEDEHSTPVRVTDPDWYPVNPLFSTDVLTTVEDCSASPCAYTGLSLTIAANIVQPGAYEGVYSPNGAYIAYVRNVRGTPSIYTWVPSAVAEFKPVFLAKGTQPDWQPVKPPPN